MATLAKSTVQNIRLRQAFSQFQRKGGFKSRRGNMGTGDNLLRADNRDGHGAGNSDFFAAA